VGGGGGVLSPLLSPLDHNECAFPVYLSVLKLSLLLLSLLLLFFSTDHDTI
jgi:hypothetical protein